MQLFIYTALIVVTTSSFLVDAGLLPSALRYGPEIVAMIAVGIFLTFGMRTGFRGVRPAYWLVLGALATVFIFSAVANGVDAGPIFAALRNYLRPLPFFLLPAVISTQRLQVKKQLLLMLLIALIQLPIAWYQRSILPTGSFTGDYTTGTMLNSGALSIFLISCACVLTACYLRRLISLKFYLPMLLLVLLPTTLNETKATVLLLPAGLLTTFVLAQRGSARFLAVIKGVVVLLFFAAIFIPVYDYYDAGNPSRDGIVEFFSNPDQISRYSTRDADIGDTDKVGRGDAITLPLRVMADDPIHLVFGYGPGNVSDSALGKRFRGEYFSTFQPFLMTLWTIVSLELGLLGFGTLLLLMWLIFQDALALARGDTGLPGALGLGWSGVVCVFVLAFFYKTLMPFTGLSFSFWYFAGLVAALRMQSVVQEGKRIDDANLDDSASRFRRREISFGWRAQRPQ